MNEEIAARAAAHGIGAVGIAVTAEFLALFVTVPFDEAEAFADEIAFDLGAAVHLYDPRSLPLSHPLHFAVAWVNGAAPRVPVPRGAVLTCWQGAKQTLPLAAVPHFAETGETIARAVPRDPLRIIPAPPLGAFLL